jgi:Icc-related predicted phosphoesterase
MTWIFSADLHGHEGRYRVLAERVAAERPRAVLLGGDLLPHAHAALAGGRPDFVGDVLRPLLARLRDDLADDYPVVLAIPGNDDPAAMDDDLAALEREGLWRWIPDRWTEVDGVPVLGYPWVPPTPFRLKDRERYDVSRFVDPGCVAPEDGSHSVPVDRRAVARRTIADDLARLTDGRDLQGAVLLAHGPPYGTALDRAALDGKKVDHAPLDVHVGSIALKRFLEAGGPAVGLHGHVHEAPRLGGDWREQVGRTWCLCGCVEGPNLALVDLDPARPAEARRRVLPV